jgi:hypothetical protein
VRIEQLEKAAGAVNLGGTLLISHHRKMSNPAIVWLYRLCGRHSKSNRVCRANRAVQRGDRTLRRRGIATSIMLHVKKTLTSIVTCGFLSRLWYSHIVSLEEAELAN